MRGKNDTVTYTAIATGSFSFIGAKTYMQCEDKWSVPVDRSSRSIFELNWIELIRLIQRYASFGSVNVVSDGLLPCGYEMTVGSSDKSWNMKYIPFILSAGFFRQGSPVLCGLLHLELHLHAPPIQRLHPRPAPHLLHVYINGLHVHQHSVVSAAG